MPDSFYGGRPGFSFIIVLNYESIDEMVSYFQQGPDYEAVHFDEHVLINTENKNDPDNGKIFRRGYDYSNDMGGAIYVGTIVGPAGRAPMLEMTTVDDVVSRQAEEGYDYRFSEGEYAPLYNLVPGKTDDGEYRDSIKWACCSVRNENNSDTTAWIGFIFPYLVVDYDADTVSAYYNRDSEEAGFTNTNLVDRMDDESHPYWEKWHISVPKGIKGDTLENFRVIVANDEDNVEPYDGQDDDREHGREILVYDYYHYDKEEGGEPVTIYLGDYNMITGITIDDDGTITVEYSHDDTLQYPNLFKWIKEVTLDTETGLFQIIYNYDEEPDGTPTIYQTYLDWVNDITMTHDGVVTIHYPNPDFDYNASEIIQWVDEITFDDDGSVGIYYNTGEEVHWENKIKWITGVELNEDGTFTMTFNNGDTDYVTNLVWVNNVTFAEDGTIAVYYNNGDNFTYDNQIKWITDIGLTETGEFHISFNNGDNDYTAQLSWVSGLTIDSDGSITITMNDGTETSYDNYLKTIADVSINTDDGDGEGSGNQKVHIEYNTGESEDIGEPLNYIMRMERDDADYHLLVWYSDPARRQALIDEGISRYYDGQDGWLDLGATRGEDGILIGFNIDDMSLYYDIALAIEYLNSEYPEGLTGTMQGKIVTIGSDDVNKECFAYDYDTDSWYYLGSLGTNLDKVFVIGTEDEVGDKLSGLSVGGLWFETEDWDV